MSTASSRAGPACAGFSGGADSATWKPRLPGAEPSAWIDTTASAPAPAPARPRSSTHGPTPWSSARVSATRTPAAASRAATRVVTSKVNACSG